MKHKEVTDEPGALFVVATPLGNLEDITRRAVRVLNEVDLIAAEDTRHTRKLLTSLGISRPMISYYKDKESSRANKVINRIQAGENVALVSDAGTPAVSDPGAVLVRHAVDKGIKIIPIPGPSAITTAVSVAGLEEGAFIFLGFLPGRKGERCSLLRSLSGQSRPLAFYESPHRVVKTLKDCLEILGDRNIFIGRELTKLHEEIFHTQVSEAVEDLSTRKKIKGELVVIVNGCDDPEPEMSGDLNEILAWYRDHAQLSMRDVVRKVSDDLGTARSVVYSAALAIWNDN